MDGHEREDVIAYRKDVFLPEMLKYERRMTQYVPVPVPDPLSVPVPVPVGRKKKMMKEQVRLEPKAPKLLEGEREVIAVFHDESSLHANEYKRSAWYVPFISF